MNDQSKKKLPTVAEMDQMTKSVTSMMVPHAAAVFRAFCEEDGVTRSEAIRLTIGIIMGPRDGRFDSADDGG